MPSPAGWREVPCVECGAFVEGIDFVERCPQCRKRRVARAARIARWFALAATLLLVFWVRTRGPATSFMRWTVIAAIPLTYVLVRTIVHRIAMEVLP